MKKAFLILFFSVSCLQIFASHIVGGEVAYTYLGPGTQPGTSRYTVLLRLFTECAQDCSDPTKMIACPPAAPLIGVFVNAAPYSSVTTLTLSLVAQPLLNLTSYPPCLSNQPMVCYKVSIYSAQVDLANNAQGYRLAYQSCCRAAAENVANDNTISTTLVPGATYEATMPGTNLLPTGHNSTAIVSLKDTALICANSPFTLDFTAVDPDSEDSISYGFSSAYNGGSFSSQVETQGPDAPLYSVVNYTTVYSGVSPLGSGVTINPVTGRISGTAPATVGRYVVNVIIKEWRNGVLIAEHRKDFLVRTNECTLTKAQIDIVPVTCDGFSVDFSQYNNSSGNITDYQWIFGDPASGVADTSTLQGPTHVYSDTGVYTLRLKVTSNNVCIDSTTQKIKVYPGFFPKLSVAGQCKNTPIQFTDLTTANYGTVNQWSWNFGDAGSTTNTSTLKNPTHIYPVENNYNIHFVVTSSKGCTGTIDTTIIITNRPAITMPHDTLICTIDTLQLNAIGAGTFLWSPNYNISNVNINNPLVSPDITTVYRLRLTDPFGCTGTDSVKISVVDHITQFAPNDSTVCKTDAIVLKLVSNALYYQWTEIPAGNTLSNPKVKTPVAIPVTTTRYHVVSSIGKCTAQSDVVLKPVPYPDADAGADQTICFGKSAQLNATGGSSYSWTPAAFLNNRLIPNPISVNPTANIKYIVSVTDTLGCPKPVHDTVIVFVAKIKADAGPRDTSVVLDQPLQLQATGSTNYLWSPAQWLNNIGISNPVSLPKDDIEYIVKVSNDAGCFDYDSIRVHVFKLDAGLYVPNAFTPNGDGNNDYFHPIILGMKSLDIFRVYNRWGQMVYSGTDAQRGWDGSFGGKPQDPATYVWYAEGTDYKNNKIKKKGYVVLIR